MTKDRIALAYTAVLAAMLISAGNFLFGNLAVKEVPPFQLAFWRSFIAILCVLPFVLRRKTNPFQFFRDNPIRASIIAVVGVVLTPWLIYLALRSDDLIDLGVAYTSLPLLTILFSAILLQERLSIPQYLGVALALVGALIFAFKGSLANVLAFNPQLAFLLMIGSNSCRALYLVLLKKWDLHPKPEEGLLVILVIGTLVMTPSFIAFEASTPTPFAYSWQVWGSILFVGIGMGALYLHLLNYATIEIGASTVSLCSYLVPVFVAAMALLVFGADIHLYQCAGAVFIVGGVLLATRVHFHTAPVNHPPH